MKKVNLILGTNAASDVPAANLMIAALASKYNWSFECVQDVCTTIKRYGSEMKDLPTSKQGFLNSLGVQKWNTQYGWICKNCNVPYYNDIFKNPVKVIQSYTCQQKPCRQSDHYVVFDLKKIIETILPTLSANSRENVHDSHFVNKIRQRQPTAGSNDYTITINTDGVPLFKSSKSSVWPILGSFNIGNLNQQKQNVMLLGLWIGSDKPNFNHFLSKFIADINDLSSNGVTWRDKNGSEKNSKIFLSHVMCDSIARPLVQGTSQFNAIYGCNFCYHKSATTEGYKSHFFKHDLTFRNLRTMASMLADSKRQHEGGDGRGVKSESPLIKISGFDLVLGFPPDVMHCCYLGITRQFTNTWLNTKNFRHEYYLGSKQKFIEVDKRLLLIRPPIRINRCPRSLENRKFFKAHEWQAWLFYYSPLVLKNILPDKFYYHWLLLVRAMSILTSEFINDNDIKEAENLLIDFSEQVHTLYDVSQCTYNVHLLLHLPYFVNQYGPLQYVSMFSFENYNQTFLKYITGTQYVSHQIAKRYLQDLVQNYNSSSQNPNSEYSQFLKTLKCNGSNINKYYISSSGVLYNKCKLFKPYVFEWSCLQYLLGLGVSYFQKFKRSSDKEIIYSKQYRLSVTRNNCCVRILHNLAIVIEVFMYVPNTKQAYAVGYLHSIQKDSHINLNYVNKSSGFRNGYVKCSELKDIMICAELNDTIYFLDFINYSDNNKSQ